MIIIISPSLFYRKASPKKADSGIKLAQNGLQLTGPGADSNLVHKNYNYINITSSYILTVAQFNSSNFNAVC